MTLCDLRPWLVRAQREQFAIGAFNANTLEQVQAVVQAAEAEQSPAVIQVSHRALQYLGSGSEMLGLEYIATIGKVAAQSVSAPVALHIDHATEDEVRRAIARGFTSVMYDGSLLPYAENVATTRRLADEARAAGVCMEAELGEVPKPGVSDDTEALTDPAEAAEFVAATGIDSLAVALGSVHAVTEKHVSIELDRLKAIRAVVSVPLVLHGSSGVLDGEIAQGIHLGLCKVNVATQLNKVFTLAARAKLEDDAGIVDPRKYLGPARAAMVEAVRERMRFFGSSGKAKP
ncbi:MAG: class II fructose-bisphosphate aldolase [Anaerolineae bacterium]|nr:class II fructose-bisphosphate aldolase [Anaerolineae bacterium]